MPQKTRTIIPADLEKEREAKVHVLETDWQNQVAPSTSATYWREYERLCAWWRERTGSRDPIRDMTTEDTLAYAMALRSGQLSGSTPLGPATVTRRLAAMSGLWALAQARGIIAVNPWRPKAGGPKRPIAEDRLGEKILTREEVERLLEAAVYLPHRALFEVMYGAGLRVSEAVGLRWRNVQWDSAGAVFLSFQGKRDKNRSVHLHPRTADWLAQIRPKAADPDAYVFPGATEGQHMTRGAAWKAVKTASRRSGLPEAASTHWLRHANASHALDAGANIRVVQESLGHADIRTTQRYTHVRPGESTGNWIWGGNGS